MGRNVFLSFLGVGKPKTGYEEFEYSINGKNLPKTKFVQKAEYDYYGDNFFDRIIILVTKSSKEKYFEELNKEMNYMAESIEISEDLNPESQWPGFEEILKLIEPEDNIYIDMTHGFRSTPIMFSVAINFLQQIKDVEIKAVYYADIYKENKPIVDFKDFFILNKWADAVSRLVENADANKLMELGKTEHHFNIADLKDNKLIESFDKLTDTIKNVDANNIAKIASEALQQIDNKKKNSSIVENILFDIMNRKFSPLSKPLSGKYDADYFEVQLSFIKLLIDHKLFMQAFTVMRECIGSIGLIFREDIKYSNSKGRDARRYAEVFINMLQFYPNLKFNEEDNKILDKLKPWYEELKSKGIEKDLTSFVKEMIALRNGFDHAWTSKSGMKDNIAEDAVKFYDKLCNVVKKIFNTTEKC
ncbi:MAG: TIGR02221 family CRISPR-associated protein [Calditerrivibrio sp.]|nr:TIGR02221 family CRISPR-associated protein [Calditerrivibrio sp.]MCA1980404.1 TIGR02221 family CRISPR-associated protein [Calditerrivibrio sp.]